MVRRDSAEALRASAESLIPKMNSIPPDESDAFLRVLQRIAEDSSLIAGEERIKALIAKIHRQGKKAQRRDARAERQATDEALRQATATVRRDTENRPFAALPDKAEEATGELQRATRCYICKAAFTRLHFFYHSLCPECAALNYAKRHQRADMTGRVALVTGGRIKIGYQIALRLLRDGARVIVTTRFPQDAARRFAAEEDAPLWRDRLTLYGLDLRDLPGAEAFCGHLSATETHLDILINNAAQTIKRPLAFYRRLVEGERNALSNRTNDNAVLSVTFGGASDNPPVLPILWEARPGYKATDATALAAYFPPGVMDADGQQRDARPANSWTLRLHEVDALEMVETHLVGAIAPALLAGGLKPLFQRSPFDRRFIVNVSAMEGQFGRESKTPRHPHTNMAKAALNMMTRTTAADYAKDSIYLNSVDTGWITDEKPEAQRLYVQKTRGFYAPLDVIDGMMRVYDPIARGVTDPATPLFGHFLKDYAPYRW